MKIVNFCPNDPRMLNRKCCEGHGLDFAKVDLFKNLTSSIINDNPYAFDEGYLSDYCRFSQVLLSLPTMDDVKNNLDLEVKNVFFCDSGLSDAIHHRMIVYADHTAS